MDQVVILVKRVTEIARPSNVSVEITTCECGQPCWISTNARLIRDVAKARVHCKSCVVVPAEVRVVYV